MMSYRGFKRALLVAAGLLTLGTSALAQSAACQRYRAELAALDRGGGRPSSAAAERQRVEISRMVNYYRSIGCERGAFLFFGAPPAECGSIAQRIRMMEANYARLVADAEAGSDTEFRRQQLIAAIQQTCAVAGDSRVDDRSVFERLFGSPRRREAEPEEEAPAGERSLGGRRLVCVRTCDGFFFPISNLPNGRESADEMCQALCPGTEAVAFSMPSGDHALERAVSTSGKPYTQLPNAFKYTKSFDPSCACKKDGESWAEILRRAEQMLDKQRGDILVTAEKAEELSRPKPIPAPTARGKDKRSAAKKPDETSEADAQAAADAGAAAPTASRESSGIGPQSIESSRVLSRAEGAKRELTDNSGSKRTVRIVAPNIIPVPEMRAQ